MKTETRVFNQLPELTTANEGRTLVGYGAVFDKDSQDLGGFTEVIDKRAFNRTVANGGDILVALNHNTEKLLGRTSAGTARVSVDDIGVRYEVDLPDTTAGRDALELTQRGDIFGSSFTFSVPKNGDSWSTRADGTRVRTLTEVRLFELGPVVSPAYLDTTVAARSLEALPPIDENDDEQDEDTDTRETTVVSESARLRRSIR